MQTVLGIDTGGTYTDAVLLEQKTKKVLKKAKSPTTRDNLAVGIGKSIRGLCLDPADTIEKVVLSTTLATNAIVEGEGRPTGLIIIGELPKGELPDAHRAQVKGKVNIKGKEVIPLDTAQVIEACAAIAPQVQAFAVSGMMSVRNASQELAVKDIIKKQCALPVVCGHELSSQLGFHDRTVTTVLNASLIPILEDFIRAVEVTLADQSIDAPVYMVKGDGNLASLSFIREKPIESILSGPAASIIGALSLAGCGDGVVVDMGGTTTDSGIVLDNTLTLAPIGARVGDWQTQIDSAQINTCGLGGDTQIIAVDGHPTLTGRRVLPACRGGRDGLTPTDLLHYTGDFEGWDRELVVVAVDAQSDKAPDAYVDEAAAQILETIRAEVLSLYEAHPVPIIAIGAPAKTWYEKIHEETGCTVIVPEHYEVANAVGAAMAAVEERVTALVRPDEENDGYVAHVAGQCRSFKDKAEAVDFVKQETEARAAAAAKAQGAPDISVQVFCDDIVEKIGWRERYIETRVKAVAKATTLKLKMQEEKDERRP
ncbi:hydantoinase/oxoprolinase family protein [Eubacterium callanderi]|uniref:hydantoinase/oxoprolinase family protein n=1 Tax=Eubacterium callanderi TaxID=53442 RepID=UPI001C1256F8|nr:hydantoinase/oxoprolinase family protein [Eubacterium callanderi]MBU5305177.1 hydantoinase/oxoprolinase family protein [Eubacterium callanderi]